MRREQSKRDATSAGIGPASGSLEKQRGLPYGGSRRSKCRFEYSPNSRSGFVELHPSWYPPKEEGPQEFKAWLEAVPGVERVEWQTTKASQRNVGNHYCEQNLLAYNSIAGPGSASPRIEIELTRNQHMINPRVTPPLTAMFKDPPEGLIGEAWKILLAACRGKELLPAHVRDYWTRHVRRWESDAPVSDSAQSSRAAGPPLSDSDLGVPLPGTPPLKKVNLGSLPLGSGCAEPGTAGQGQGAEAWSQQRERERGTCRCLRAQPCAYA